MWKRISNYEDYDVNENGEVRSRKQGRTKVLTPVFVNGYPKVLLYKEGQRKQVYIHRLVWEAFNGPIPVGMCVLHGDGNDRANASLEYLRLGSHKENMEDKVRDGSSTKGETNANSRLTGIEVKSIKQMLRDKVSIRKVAKLFEVGSSTICHIKNGRTWAHIT